MSLFLSFFPRMCEKLTDGLKSDETQEIIRFDPLSRLGCSLALHCICSMGVP